MFWLERAFAKRIGPALFSKCLIYLLPPRPFASCIKHTKRRPYDNSFTTNGDETVSTTTSVQMRITAPFNEPANSSIITIISEANVCWRWWPSLRLVHRYCALPNTCSYRSHARRLLIRRVGENGGATAKPLTVESINRMSMHNVKRHLVNVITKYNRSLAIKRFGFNNSIDLKIVSGEGYLAIPIPIGVPDATVRIPCTGMFFRDSELSPWGLFVTEDGFRMRLVHPMVRLGAYDEHKMAHRCELVSKSLNTAWMEHVWKRINEEVSARTRTQVEASAPVAADRAISSVSSVPLVPPSRRRTRRRARQP